MTDRQVAAVPIALFVLFLLAFIISSALFTTCGKFGAGCPEIAGAGITTLIEPDTVAQVRGLYAVPDTITDAAKRLRTATQPSSSFKVAMSRIERRFVWAFFAGLSGILSVINLLIALGIVWDWTKRRRAVFVALGVTVAVTVGLTLAPTVHMGVLHPLLEATVARATIALGMPSLPNVMAFLNGFSSAVALTMAIAVWYLLQRRVYESGDAVADAKKTLADLNRKSVLLQIFLYATTAGLVTGVLRMNTTIYWMQSYLPLAHQAGFDSFRTTMVSVIGGFYSLLLAALYIPAVIILKSWASRAIAAAPVDAALAANESQTVFAFQWSKVLTRALAILGPLLAGPVGEFLKGLAGG